MRRGGRILALCCGIWFGAPAATWAQGAWDEILALPERVDGICQVYPQPEEALTPAPRGYSAFYLSHYGRHGSRFSHRDDYYTDPLRMLQRADSVGVLTPLGQSLLSRLEMQYAAAKGHIGELTAVGEAEHAGIAERMVRRFPSVFRRGARVDARSTASPRVILSMSAALERLRVLRPGISVTRSASPSYRELGAEYPMPGRDSIIRRCLELIDARFDRAAFAAKLFTDPSYAEGLPDLNRDAWHLYYTAANLRCVGLDGDLYRDVLPLEEMYVFWQATNYLLYCSCGNAPYNSATVLRCAQPMLADILSRADAAVSAAPLPDPPGHAGSVVREADRVSGTARPSGSAVHAADLRFGQAAAAASAPGTAGPSGSAVRGVDRVSGTARPLGSAVHAADLRFGHDVYLLPLASLMGLTTPYHADPYTCQEVWRYYDISPMSGNIQLVFYAPRKALRARTRALRRGADAPFSPDDVLVKVLLNEQERLLGTPEGHGLPPAPQPVTGPYYRWSDLRAWFENLCRFPF